ncbi:zinc-binding alcohol dehydrogenase family protein [Rubritalea tangerina]|uniref:Zinc-type alcohol dehydrogenase-like protein n=1 Tax=Rubritalea tangerina TaxID=430798 RepID=A0ABW4ZBA8_9BACT
MKAIGYRQAGSITRDDALINVEIERPEVSGRDILVRVEAVSVNPVDVKLRGGRDPEGDGMRILGFDAAGVVEAIGAQVENFAVGDRVFHAGSIARPGTNSEYHLVDERIVGGMPKSLDFSAAAALPLTAITAWEMLFDRLEVERPTAEGGDCILVVGGAGGVGSITIQLLRALTDLKVIATASRPETRAWVEQCGAHYVIDHREAMAPQVKALGIGAPGYVFSTNHTAYHFPDIVELIAPQGRFGLIDDPEALDVMPLKLKAISLHWELMFTRSLFETPDMAKQAALLNKLAELVDAGKVQSTVTEVLGKIDAATLKKAHAAIESGRTRGKLVLEGF